MLQPSSRACSAAPSTSMLLRLSRAMFLQSLCASWHCQRRRSPTLLESCFLTRQAYSFKAACFDGMASLGRPTRANVARLSTGRRACSRPLQKQHLIRKDWQRQPCFRHHHCSPSPGVCCRSRLETAVHESHSNCAAQQIHDGHGGLVADLCRSAQHSKDELPMCVLASHSQICQPCGRCSPCSEPTRSAAASSPWSCSAPAHSESWTSSWRTLPAPGSGVGGTKEDIVQAPSTAAIGAITIIIIRASISFGQTMFTKGFPARNADPIMLVCSLLAVRIPTCMHHQAHAQGPMERPFTTPQAAVDCWGANAHRGPDPAHLYPAPIHAFASPPHTRPRSSAAVPSATCRPEPDAAVGGVAAVLRGVWDGDGQL